MPEVSGGGAKHADSKKAQMVVFLQKKFRKSPKMQNTLAARTVLFINTPVGNQASLYFIESCIFPDHLKLLLS